MNVTSFIASRYLKASKENRFFSWISILSIVGISIGVCAMIVVLSVINGFESELRDRFLAANAHILAYRYPAGLRDYPRWEEEFEKKFGEDITGVSPFVHADTMGKKDNLIHAFLIKGIDPRKRAKVQDLSSIIRPKSALDELQKEVDNVKNGKPIPEAPAIIIGRRLALLIDAKVGDIIQLIAPEAKTSDPYGNMKKYTVVGLYDSGLQHYDNKLGLMSVPAAQILFNMGDIVTGLEIGLKKPDDSKDVALRMQDQFQISIKEWQSYNKNIFEAMKTEKGVISLIVALVAFVASFNILTTLFVSVTQKHRAIAILKALGATNQQVLSIFLKQSLLIGGIGGLLGMIFAVTIAKIIEVVPIVDLPDIYLLAKLPVKYQWEVYLSVSLCGLLIAAVAGIYPAITATRVDPIDGLREGTRR